MSESVVQSQRSFSSSFSLGNGCLAPFSHHTPTNCQGSVSNSLFGTFQASAELPKMQLDTESLYSLITEQMSHGLSGDRTSSAPSKSTDASVAAEWARCSSAGSSTDAKLGKSMDLVAATEFAGSGSAVTTASFAHASSFLPSKVEQLSSAFECPVPPQKPAMSFLNGDALSANQLASDLDERLQIKMSPRRQSLDFLTKMASTLEPSVIGEKKFMTMTERIQVPTSDHVAEIVGKNGQRIKHLREQLKVWVKTPSRDELPVFEITGLPEKLIEAKRIILQMSEHFTKVQQERLSRAEPNRVEDRLYVDQDKVGLIVGASGQTIRWVQQLSDTHIATPRKQESIPGLPPPQTYFTICGTRERVRFAKQLICEYVNLRCQGLWLEPDLEVSPEAARLVCDFHQRRQVEDTQRRGSAPAGVSIATAAASALAHLATSSDDPEVATATSQALSSSLTLAGVKRLWQEGGPPPSVWDSVLFGGMASVPPPPLPPPTLQAQQPTMSSVAALADRRYSVDAHSVAMHHQQQQQRLLQLRQRQQQELQQLQLDQERERLLFGFDPLVKKCHSDEEVAATASAAPPSSCINGWM